jgi:two-component system, LuxR family, sensor kinase FixL
MAEKQSRPWRHPTSLIALCAYIAAYVFLDRISLLQALPNVGFTLWNPPPACSLALLLIKGFQFAPALFAAAVLGDVLNGAVSIWVMPALVLDGIIAAGYAGLALLLRAFVRPGVGLRSVRDVSRFLGIIAIGVLAIACVADGALVLMGVVPANNFADTVRYFWVGDVTGIVVLFPVLMSAPFAWKRWRELPARERLVDLGAFTLGLALALWVVFAMAPPDEDQFFYLLLLPVIWIGVRHGLPWCAMAILIEQLALVALITLLAYPASDFIAFQIFSITVAIAGLVLGAVVTERQGAEQKLRQQQAELSRMTRLATAGALGSAIVHEISQPLATLATYAHACRHLPDDRWQTGELLTQTLGKIELEALRAGNIVERLRAFLTKGDPQLDLLTLDDAVRGVADALVDEAQAHGVEIRIEAQSEATILADRVQVEQILVNLVRNGIEAAAERTSGEKQVKIRISQSSGEICVDVEDNGPGVADDIAERLFEPFTTSKPRGMGLGLLLSRQIVETYGGKLWCERTSAKGTRFAFCLPCDRNHVDDVRDHAG